MDLIDRQAIYDKVTARYPDSDATQYNIGYADAINDVLKDIRYMPSVQKTGKWIIFPPCFEEICMCSNCKTKFKEAYQHRDTCPSCGARMGVEE